MSEKGCTKCKEKKPTNHFSKSPRRPDGLSSWCKVCHSAYEKEYRKRKQLERLMTPEERRLLAAEKKAKAEASRRNKAEYKKRWAAENAERVTAAQRSAYMADRARRKAKAKARYEANKPEILAKMRDYAARNKPLINKRFRARYRRNPQLRSAVTMRGMLARALKSTGASKTAATSELLRYCRERLRQRIEVQFKPGMSWDNHGAWHIDHKIPIAHFIAKGETRPWVINALCNLQPLWAEDNWRKYTTHHKEFRQCG